MSSFPIDAELALKWGLVQQICATNEELDQKAIDVAKMISRNHPMMTKRYKSLMEQGNLGTYAEGLVLEDTSDKSFYETLTDLDATLKDGAGKFQEMLTWAKSLP